MNNNNLTIEESLLTDTERVVKKQKSATLGLTLAVIGTVCFALPLLGVLPEGNLSLVAYTIGILFLLIGLGRLLMPKYGYYDKQTGTELKHYEVYFDNAEANKAVSLYQQSNFNSLGDLKFANQTGLLLHIYGTSDGSLFYTMLMKYVPYQFVAVQEMRKHTDVTEISAIQTIISKSQNI